MKNQNVKHSITGLKMVVVLYLVGAFIEQDFDFANWDKITRFVIGVMSGLVAVITIGALNGMFDYEETDEE